MKTRQPSFRSRRALGMTLAELMVASAVFGMSVIGLVYTHLFALRQDELVNSKLGASEESRMAFDKLTDEIRSASMWMLGNGSDTTFTAIPNGTTQQGGALQLYPTTDTNSYVRYFFDTNNFRLCRAEGGVNGYDVIAENLTNTMYFRAEDYAGNVKTDLSYKYVIAVKVEFAQFQYPLTHVGNGYYYDYYKMEFKVTPHCPNGE